MSYSTVPAGASGAIAVERNDAAVGSRARINFIEGSNITLTAVDDGGEIDLTIAAPVAGSGAPTDAQYVTLVANATLTAERTLAGESGVVSITDGGAGAAVTVGLASAGVADAKLANMGARTVKGRAANSSGVPADIAGGGAGTFASDNATSLAFRAMTSIIEDLSLSGDISPAQLTADVNDYNPTNLATSSILRLDADAARAITGIAGGADGRVLALFNISAFSISLTDASIGSAAANRFEFGADLVLGVKHGALIWYDSTSSRWRLLTRGFPFTAVPDTRTVTAGAGMTGGGALGGNITLNVAAGDSSITVNADDIVVATNGITTAKIAANQVTYAKIQQGSALSVLGVTGNATADLADIAAGVDGQVLRRSGTTLAFGTVVAAGLASDSVTTAKIADDQVTDAKLRNSGALSVIGRSANSTGDPADIATTASSDAVLRESGGTLGFGTVAAGGLAANAVTTAKILDANVTDAKLADMAARTVKGRAANSTGVPGSIAGGGAATFLSDDGSTLAFRVVDAIAEDLALQGDISPAQLTADQNDYNPTGLSTATVLRLTSDANRLITGISGGADGRILTLLNVGSNPITASDANTGSLAANRFDMGFSVALLPRRGLILQYDGTSSRWRRFSTEVEQVVEAMTDGATVTPNLDNGWKKRVTLGGNRTMAAPTGAKIDGMFLEIAIIQDGTGSRTVTWTSGAAGFRFTTDVTSPTLSTGAGKIDYILFRYTATDDRWDAMAFNKAA